MPKTSPQSRLDAPQSSRDKLLASAIACFDENGLSGMTIEQIRRRANSSIGSLYHHFGNRDGLIAALFLQLLDEQMAWSQPALEQAATPYDVVDALIRGYLDWVGHHPREARFMYAARSEVAAGANAAALKEKNKQRFGHLMGLLKAGVESGEVRSLPRETYASLLVGASENYCRAWLAGRVSGEPVTHASVFVDAAWRSISVSPAD
ncbi:TetR family transcriptional regulator [Salinisphaera sp. S4-8]|uniref:TetR/AcrR family transcriptional regulator n=1 Tax=Salinisphaera sp. S4-8 TaxID=633357 RepID=UPI00334061A9